jgi:hypothetical protein
MNKKSRTKQVLTRTKRKTTESEFNSVVPLLSISPDRINAAKKVMVDKKPLQVVADEYGVSRQSIDGSIKAVWSTILKYREGQALTLTTKVFIPPGWEQVTLIAPKRLIEKFKTELEKESFTVHSNSN